MDACFKNLTRFFAFFVFSILVAILISLAYHSQLTLSKFGFEFLFVDEWDPVKEEFGALVPIYGTLVSSAIAMIIGIPVSFGIALFLTELSPNWLKRPLGTAIEMLAAIPSIIYGLWGIFVLVPFLRATARLPLYAPRTVSATLGRTIVSPANRHQFYTVTLHGTVALPAFKGSGDITSLSQADGYIEIPASEHTVEEGSAVEVTLF